MSVILLPLSWCVSVSQPILPIMMMTVIVTIATAGTRLLKCILLFLTLHLFLQCLLACIWNKKWFQTFHILFRSIVQDECFTLLFPSHKMEMAEPFRPSSVERSHCLCSLFVWLKEKLFTTCLRKT